MSNQKSCFQYNWQQILISDVVSDTTAAKVFLTKLRPPNLKVWAKQVNKYRPVFFYFKKVAQKVQIGVFKKNNKQKQYTC